jgi:hypothetical protein
MRRFIDFILNVATAIIIFAMVGPKIDRALQKLIEKRTLKTLEKSDGHRPPLQLK